MFFRGASNAQAPLTFAVELRKPPGMPLGIDVVQVTSGRGCALVVDCIHGSATVAAWNQQQREPFRVHPGDFIVMINGYEGDIILHLIGELRSVTEVRLQIMRLSPEEAEWRFREFQSGMPLRRTFDNYEQRSALPPDPQQLRGGCGLISTTRPAPWSLAPVYAPSAQAALPPPLGEGNQAIMTYGPTSGVVPLAGPSGYGGTGGCGHGDSFGGGGPQVTDVRTRLPAPAPGARQQAPPTPPTAPPSVGMDSDGNFTFEAFFAKADGARLGIDVLPANVAAYSGLAVKRILQGGVVDRWNQSNPGSSCIRPGDVIVRVNGVASELPQMMRELRSKLRTRVTLMRSNAGWPEWTPPGAAAGGAGVAAFAAGGPASSSDTVIPLPWGGGIAAADMPAQTQAGGVLVPSFASVGAGPGGAAGCPAPDGQGLLGPAPMWTGIVAAPGLPGSGSFGGEPSQVPTLAGASGPAHATSGPLRAGGPAGNEGPSAPVRFSVEIVKGIGSRLGIDTIFSRDRNGCRIVVASVCRGGCVDRWNQRSLPPCQVQSGDEIVQVNGVSNRENWSLMYDELSKDRSAVNFVVQRGNSDDFPSSAPWNQPFVPIDGEAIPPPPSGTAAGRLPPQTLLTEPLVGREPCLRDGDLPAGSSGSRGSLAQIVATMPPAAAYDGGAAVTAAEQPLAPPAPPAPPPPPPPPWGSDSASGADGQRNRGGIAALRALWPLPPPDGDFLPAPRGGGGEGGGLPSRPEPWQRQEADDEPLDLVHVRPFAAPAGVETAAAASGRPECAGLVPGGPDGAYPHFGAGVGQSSGAQEWRDASPAPVDGWTALPNGPSAGGSGDEAAASAALADGTSAVPCEGVLPGTEGASEALGHVDLGNGLLPIELLLRSMQLSDEELARLLRAALNERPWLNDPVTEALGALQRSPS